MRRRAIGGSPPAVQRPIGESEPRLGAEELRLPAPAPEPVDPVGAGMLPEIRRGREGRGEAEQLRPADGALGPAPELELDPLVRVEGEQPVRTMVEGGSDEVTAVGGLVHASDGRPACGSGRQRADGAGSSALPSEEPSSTR